METEATLEQKAWTLMPPEEAGALKAELRLLWARVPGRFTPAQFLRQGLDVWLSRKGAVANMGGYLFMGLRGRLPTGPTPALDRALADDRARQVMAAGTSARSRDRAESDAAADAEAAAVMCLVAEYYPEFATWSVGEQARLFMILGENPRQALAARGPQLSVPRRTI